MVENGKRVKEKARENLAELLEALVQIVSSYGKDISNYSILQLIDALRNKPHYDYALSQAQRTSNVKVYKRHILENNKPEIAQFDF
jgi:hypothetical protein